MFPAPPRKRRSGRTGWTLHPEGESYRQVVPSPEPQRILELVAIRTLVESGVIVICAGGGGVPVATTDGRWRGVEAVIDKDLAAALLSRELGADALVLLTDVDAIYADWGSKESRPIARVTIAELRELGLEEGSMGPKAEAACRAVEAGASFAAIGHLSQAADLVERREGTVITAR